MLFRSMLQTNTSLNLFMIPLAIILVAWLVRSSSRRNLEDGHVYSLPINNFISVLLLLLVCWNAISLFWAPNFVVGLIHFIKLLANIGVFYLFYCCIDRRDVLRRVAWTCLFLGIFLSLVCFYSLYIIDFAKEFPQESSMSKISAVLWDLNYKLTKNISVLAQWRVHRARGSAFSGPGDLGLILNFIIAIVFGLLLATKKAARRRRFFLTTIVILLVACHLTTLSKSATIGLLAMIGFYLIFVTRLRESFIRNSFVTVSVLIGIFVIVQCSQLMMAAQRFGQATLETSAPTRIEWWGTILPLCIQKTLGVGLGIGGSFFYLHPDAPHAHSVCFSVFSDMGVVGSLLFGLIALAIIMEVLPIIKRQITFCQIMLLASCAAMTALAFQGLFDFHYNEPKVWMITGFSMACLRLAKKELAEQQISEQQA